MDACHTLTQRHAPGVVRRGRHDRDGAVGGLGEEVAARYLAAAGYRILGRNWRCGDPDLVGELDIVARRHGLLVVCEVKTRSSSGWGDPAEAVTPAKAERLRRLAARWQREHRERRASGAERASPPRRLRIDVLGVVLIPGGASVRHLRGVC